MLTTVPFEPEPASLEGKPESSSGPPSTPDELRVYRAIKFLEQVLAHGPLPSTWVMEEGKRHRHAKRTLMRARHKRNVQALKSSAFGGGSLWYMALPDDPVVALFKRRKRGDRQAAIERIKQSMAQFQARDSPEAIRVG